MSKKNLLIDFRAWQGRGEGWISWLFNFIKYPAYAGLFGYVFPFIPIDNYTLFILGIFIAIATTLIGYLDYKKGIMLKEAERTTVKFNPYMNKIQQGQEVMLDRLHRIDEFMNELIRIIYGNVPEKRKMSMKRIDHSPPVKERFCKHIEAYCREKLKYCNHIKKKCDINANPI